jgi:hypothetical protein
LKVFRNLERPDSALPLPQFVLIIGEEEKYDINKNIQ